MHSLVGKMLGTKMGDRYLRDKPKKSDEKREKRQKRDEAQQKFKGGKAQLTDKLSEVAGVFYTPKTQVIHEHTLLD